MSKLQSVDIDKVKFKEILKKKGYTQQSLADTIYCSQQYISKCKWGINIFKRICDVLEISPEDILLYPYQAMLIDEEFCSQYETYSKQWEEEKADKLSISGLSQSFIGLIKQSGYIIEASMITDDGENISKAKTLDNINFYDAQQKETYLFTLKTDTLLSIQNEVIHYLSYLIKKESED